MNGTTARALAATLAVGLLLAVADPARAGEYHYGATLVCYDCHTIHYSQRHTYTGPEAPAVPPAAGGPFAYLLRATDSALCLSCHDGQAFAPDVRGANTGNHVRQAGALTTGAAPHENWKGHTLVINAKPPGGTVAIRLQCVNCHEPHGSASYRNLQGVVTYAKSVNDTTKDVFLRSWIQGQIATNYSAANVDFNEPDGRLSAMGRFCRGCHTDFHGAKGEINMGGAGGTGWLRHPTADADIGAVGGQHSSLDVFKNTLYRVKVMSPSGDWGTPGQTWPGAPANLTPTCITCHRAHGNQNAFGLIYPTGTIAITEEGDGTDIRSLCAQCHAQGI